MLPEDEAEGYEADGGEKPGHAAPVQTGYVRGKRASREFEDYCMPHRYRPGS